MKCTLHCAQSADIKFTACLLGCQKLKAAELPGVKDGCEEERCWLGEMYDLVTSWKRLPTIYTTLCSMMYAYLKFYHVESMCVNAMVSTGKVVRYYYYYIKLTLQCCERQMNLYMSRASLLWHCFVWMTWNFFCPTVWLKWLKSSSTRNLSSFGSVVLEKSPKNHLFWGVFWKGEK